MKIPIDVSFCVIYIRGMINGDTTRTEDVMNEIRGFLEETGKSLSFLARRSKISATSVQGVWGGDWNPTARTLICLERYLSSDEAKELMGC